MDVSYARDLVELLQLSNTADQAAELLLSLSGSSFFLQLCRDDSDYATSLAKACGRTLSNNSPSARTARRNVAQACVNLAQLEAFHGALQQAGTVRRVVEALRLANSDGDEMLLNATLKLLVNLTRSEQGQLQFLGGEKKDAINAAASAGASADYLAEITIDLLLRRYCGSVDQVVESTQSEGGSVYNTVPLIFVNLSCQLGGRKLLLGRSEEDRIARCSKFAEAALFRPLQRPELLQLLLHLALSSECHSCLTDERCKALEVMLQLGKQASAEDRKKILLILQALTRSTAGVLALLNYKVLQVISEEWRGQDAADVAQLKAILDQYSIVDDPACLPPDLSIENALADNSLIDGSFVESSNDK